MDFNNLSVPTRVVLCTTSKCNFSCKHCLAKGPNSSKDDLTKDEMLKVIDELARSRVFSVNIFGGEPLCDENFFTYLEKIYKYNMKLSLNTNGTLITKDTLSFLKKHGVESLCISFDGSCSHVMDAMRGTGAFNKAIKGIELAVEEGMGVLLSSTVTKYNHRDFRNMISFGKKIGAKAIRFNSVFRIGNADCFMNDIYLTLDEEFEAIKTINELGKEFGSFVIGSYLDQAKKFAKGSNILPPTSKIVVNPCGAGRQNCTIRADGWVTPCEILYEEKIGNLKESSLGEIWQSEKMGEFRKPFILDLEDFPECINCKYQYMCYTGHRCYPYYYPDGLSDKAIYCWSKLKNIDDRVEELNDTLNKEVFA